MSRILPLMILFCLFGCFGQKKIIKVGTSPVLTSAGIFLAHELGYFSEDGLNVEILPFRESGAPMTMLLSSGALDIGGGNFTSGLFQSMSEGSGIKIVADKGHIAPNHSYISVILRSDLLTSGKVKDVRDLRGLKFGFTALNGVSQQIVLDKLLKRGGLTISDIQSLKYPYSSMNIALKNGELDGAVQIEPFVTYATQDGIAKVFATSADIYADQQSAGILFARDFSERYPKEAIKFLKAYLRGVRAYNEAFIHQKEKSKIISLLKKHISINDDKVWFKLTPAGIDPNGKIKWESLEEDIKWYVSKKFLDVSLTKETVIDETFLNEALKEIGYYSE